MERASRGLPARRFYTNISAAFLAVTVQLFIMYIYFVGYLPTFHEQPFAEKITIVGSLVTATFFFIGEGFMIGASIWYERPSQQRKG